MRCAGIVTYNPDLERLRANLNNTVSQVDAVFIFDNGSENVADIRSLANSEYTTVKVEADPSNRGIAFALNRLLDAAKEHGFKHMLLLDQDSVPTEGMCDELERHLTGSVALVCPFILDRNRMTEEEWQAQKMPPLERLTHAAQHGAITSGSLVDVAAALEVGGFDDNLFIDYVDFDFNERLILNGYEIVKDNTVYLLHEKGKSERTWLKVPRRTSAGVQWQPLYKLGYSPMRCYYQSRNRIVYWKKYHRHTGGEGLTEIPLLMALSLLFENHRIAKLRAYSRGIHDGMKMKVVEYRK